MGSNSSTGKQKETVKVGGEDAMVSKRAKGIGKTTNRGGEEAMGRMYAGELKGNKTERGGETNMKGRIVLALVFVGLMSGIAGAYQTTDSVVLTVTPVFAVSVNISSTTNQFGTASVALGESRTICVGTIQNDGNVSTYWDKKCTTTARDAKGTPNTWTLLTTDVNTGLDNFKLLAITTGTAGVGRAPNFTAAWANADSNACIKGRHTVVAPTTQLLRVTDTDTSLVEGTGASSSPKHVAGETRLLWVSIMMPTTITDAVGAYSMTLSVGAKTTGP
jgi:hypothetical protein